MSWTVGELARLAGVTVRTLHHYDRIGLVRPSQRTAAGYRSYDVRDLDRLQQRKDPPAPHTSHARRGPLQAGRVTRSCGLVQGPAASLRVVGRTRSFDQAMVAAVEKEMEARQMGIQLTPEERFEVFGQHDPAQYDAEVEERWGDTDAYAQSKRRTATCTKEDWLRIKDEGADVERRFADALQSGVPAVAARAMDVAEEHRQHIGRWFYDCPPQLHAGLGRMYVEDPRFTAHYEEIAPGLAQYVSTAVQANAARQG